MSQDSNSDVLPSPEDLVIYHATLLKNSTQLFEEIESLYYKCVRDGITSNNQGETDEAFSTFYDHYKSICKEPEFDKNKAKEYSKDISELLKLWFEQLIPNLEPKNFFEKKVNNIIDILKTCKQSSAEGFSKNADSEIKSLEYFKKQLSYTITEDANNIQPFPSYYPIYPYNLEDGGPQKNNFLEAMSMSQYLAEQFQEFKDLWFLLRIFSLNMEIIRLQTKDDKSNYFYKIQYLLNILTNNQK